jgi:methylisocitrate lyase
MATETRSAGADLRRRMNKGTVVAAGAFMPFVARLVEEAGFDAVYVSGGALSNSLARPDEGLLPRNRFLSAARDIRDVVDLPIIVDVDTGFGGPAGTARTVQLFEQAGAAAVQIEDQDPRWKRCGHLEGKHLISSRRMAEKIEAAVQAKRDGDFVIIARTDARAVEGLEAAIERAQAYVEAGADVVFPEAPESREEFIAFREALSVPLLANMTEFGKSPWITDAEFAELKYDIVIHPVTPFRLTALAVKQALDEMKQTGNQKSLVDAGRLMNRRDIDSYLRPE